MGISAHARLSSRLARNGHLKRFITIVAIISAANFLLFWIAYGGVMIGWPQPSLSQFLGFSPPPAPPPWFAFCLWAFIVLGAPGSIILDGTGSDAFIWLLLLASMLNCVIWGLVLGLPVYALCKKFGSYAAEPAVTR